MLAYFKNYKTYSYAISFITPLVVIGIVFLVTGVNPMTGIAGGVIFLVLMIAMLFATSKIFGKKADEEAERMLALYDRDCDPEAFKDQAKLVARAIYEECYTATTTELGAWFLAPYALACADLGANDDAQMMETALLKGLNDDMPALEHAGILISLEPLVLRLHGPNEALSTALQAQSYLEGDSSDDAQSKMSYLNFELPLLQAMIAGDATTLLKRFESVVKSESSPMRIRVLDADALASLYDAAGNLAGKRSALDFVVKNGNRMPVVEPARIALAQL